MPPGVAVLWVGAAETERAARQGRIQQEFFMDSEGVWLSMELGNLGKP